jgi:hypothetical protein
MVVLPDLSAGRCTAQIPLFPDEEIGACANIIRDLTRQTAGVIPRRAAGIHHLHDPISTGITDESPIPLAGVIAVAVELSPTGFPEPNGFQDNTRNGVRGRHSDIVSVGADSTADLVVSRAGAAQTIGCRIIKSRAHRGAIWLPAAHGWLVRVTVRLRT